jgi:mannose-6-phosphate isomerase-like protein (cupin superfamily)
MKNNNLIFNEQNVNSFQGTCGIVKDLVNQENSKINNVSIAVIVVESMKHGQEHFHNNTEEIYFVLEGKGSIMINKNIQKIEKDDCIIIPIKQDHKLINNTKLPLKILVINSPPYSEDDTFDSR